MVILKQNWEIILIAAILTVPVVGFVYGMMACKNCNGISGNLFGRPFIGIIHAFLAINNPGKIPLDEGGVTGYVSLKRFLLPSFVILTIIFYLVKRYFFHKGV